MNSKGCVIAAWIAAGLIVVCAMIVAIKPSPPRMCVQPWPYKVPRHIWQTWHTHDMAPAMRAHVERIQATHPEYEYTLMDDAESLRFINANYPAEVGQAYEALIPGAFKADLWRLCALHKAGGIYLDIKYAPVEGTSLRNMGEDSHFPRDMNQVVIPQGIHNGVMAAAPGDPRLEAAIKQIVKNVRAKYYGMSPLHPTGPNLLIKYVCPHHSDVDMQFVYPLKVRWKGNEKTPFIQGYSDYRTDQQKTQKKPYYTKLWWKRKIYNHDADIYKS
jgi:mannosyltransferase OCH1-like enzyme